MGCHHNGMYWGALIRHVVKFKVKQIKGAGAIIAAQAVISHTTCRDNLAGFYSELKLKPSGGKIMRITNRDYSMNVI